MELNEDFVIASKEMANSDIVAGSFLLVLMEFLNNFLWIKSLD